MKTLSILILLIFCNISFSQELEFSNTINDIVQQITFQEKLNTILLSTNNYKDGDKVRIFASFVLNEKGRLMNITVRAPHPKIEKSVKDLLNKIIIQEELTKQLLSKHEDGKFAIPIIYYVISRSKMKRIIAKHNRKKNKS
ncbi:hypothetical protein [uncultured Winogradskyella sp.]|uniref:hypothetical protein n=1 Tax=uncultured Winogradskyella sp. TaxID=395353 RepID=UPI0026303D88|nr:hypothetical protein [uncultured Winogradskyella sp.]